ncbi:MAG: DUF6597 domain-containing transcriptional factor [Planctomycetota bacterium]|jgi:AraC-like DNA-binding protein
MDFAIHQPDGLLASFVKCMWSMELGLAPGQTTTERVAPTGCSCLLFNYGDRPSQIGAHGQWSLQPWGHIAGQRTSFTDVQVSGPVGLVAVVLRPEVNAAVLGLPASELSGQQVEVEQVFGPAGARVCQQVVEAPGPGARFRLLERFLVDHLAAVDPIVDPRVRAFVRQVTASGGQLSVEQLASRLDLSRRQLERQVGAAVGMTPKEFCRIVRYQKVLALKQHDPSLSLTQLAYGGGYADQAHFNREFSRITGYTPKRAFERCPAFSDYYTYV